MRTASLSLQLDRELKLELLERAQTIDLDLARITAMQSWERMRGHDPVPQLAAVRYRAEAFYELLASISDAEFILQLEEFRSCYREMLFDPRVCDEQTAEADAIREIILNPELSFARN